MTRVDVPIENLENFLKKRKERECSVPSCEEEVEEKSQHCSKHSSKSQPKCGPSNFCSSDTGDKQCAGLNCNKVTKSGSQFCESHGDNTVCSAPGCSQRVAGSSLNFCDTHAHYEEKYQKDSKDLSGAESSKKSKTEETSNKPSNPKSSSTTSSSDQSSAKPTKNRDPIMQVLAMLEWHLKYQSTQVAILEAHLRAQQQTIQHLLMYYVASPNSPNVGEQLKERVPKPPVLPPLNFPPPVFMPMSMSVSPPGATGANAFASSSILPDSRQTASSDGPAADSVRDPLKNPA